MKKRLLWLLLIICPLLASGQEKFDYKAAEERIKKHIFSSPDSTRIIIDEILAKKNLPDSIRGTVYNIYGIYYSHIGQLDSSMAYYKKSVAMLKNYPAIRTMPLMNISVGYRNKGEYEASFRCLEEALEINKSLGLKDKEALVYSNMSSNYQFMLEYDKAVEYALKGIEILKKEKVHPSGLASLRQKLANTYLKMENFHFAKELYEECLRDFKARNDNVSYSLTLINYAEALIHLGEFGNARRSLYKAIAELKIIKNPEHLAIAYSKLGTIAKYEEDKEEAIKSYEAAFGGLAAANSLNAVMVASEYVEFLNMNGKYGDALRIIEIAGKLPIFKNVNAQDKLRFDVAAAETYSKTNNEKEALAGLERALELKDSIARADNQLHTKELQAKFQTTLQEEKRTALKLKSESLQKTREADQILILIYGTVSLAIILLTLLYLRSSWLSARLRKEALKLAATEKSILQQQHEYEKEITQAQKDIIVEKQRELASTALKMANFQDTILQIVDNCGTADINKVGDVKKELEKLVKQKEYWGQFETRFNALHPEFGSALANRYSNLTKNDIEFCALLKLNLTNKEIATLLQISHESAITRKYRIKKKMAINDDTDFEKAILEI